MYIVVSVLTLALVIGALIDIITRDEWQVKHLPKLVWVLLVVFLPLVGSIIWFAVGREYSRPVERGTFGDSRRWAASLPAAQPTKSTEEQLAELEREIEFYEGKRDRDSDRA
ncbi:MAG: PLDc N-terminal domain-containing protein [Lacisediminihabitans sp.]